MEIKQKISTKEILEQLNISRSTITYWIRNKKISTPRKDNKNRYIWEKKHIEEMKELISTKKQKNKNTIKKFEIQNRRYLGNKYKLLPFIRDVITKHCKDVFTFADIFAGSGVVANEFSNLKIITNDILYNNYVSHYAWFSNEKYNYKKLKSIIDKFNKLEINEDNYMSVNFGDTYFDVKNARKIGYIREEIENMSDKLNKREKYILITSLLYAMDKIANTCGHYDAFRKKIDNDKKLELLMLSIPKKINPTNEIYNMDANELVRNINADLVYIDPPYNSRQYSDAYHLLENIARWEKPEVFGVAKKMDRSNIKSKYCTVSAPKAFEDLIENINAKYILVSYNNMGEKGVGRSNAKISDDEIVKILKKKGSVKIFKKDYKAFTTGKSEIEDHEERLFLCRCKTFHNLTDKSKLIESPLNYTGGKFKLLPQILPLFPKDINKFLDLFCGGCNVGINIDCEEVKFVDNQKQLMDLYNTFKLISKERIIEIVEGIIEKYNLSKTSEYGYKYYNCDSSKGVGAANKENYNKMKEDYNNRNQDNDYYNLVFYVLIVYSFNNQIRFNNEGQYNLPVGKRDFNKKMKRKLIKFIEKVKDEKFEFINLDFNQINIDEIDKETFIYADPPYLITCASYNEQNGWNEEKEKDLLNFLDKIHSKGIRFALSNVLISKGKKNDILAKWVNKNNEIYKVNYLNYDYKNSNYQTKNREENSTEEVLITNY